MMDALASLLAWFNWIDKADTLIRGAGFIATGRGLAVIEFTPPDGVAAIDCERWLHRRGIGVFGRNVIGTHEIAPGAKRLMFQMHCSAKQRQWAEYILLRGGATVWNVQDARNQTWAARHASLPPAWKDRR
jgi:hypothetical protein